MAPAGYRGLTLSAMCAACDRVAKDDGTFEVNARETNLRETNAQGYVKAGKDEA